MRKIEPKKIEKEMSMDAPVENYPYFSIDLKHLPEAKKWSIGDTYYVTLAIKQKSIEVSKYDGEERGYAGFDITGIEIAKKPKENYKELPDLA